MEEINKITTVEFLLWLMLLLLVDGVCILIDLTGFGVFIAPIIQGLFSFLVGWWLKNSKSSESAMKFWRQTIKYAANLLPVTPFILTAFTTTIAFIIEAFLHNHPKAVPAAILLAKRVTKLAIKKT